MTQNNPQVPWTDEQWARINQVIHEEASRARIAARFLPLFGPLPGDADFIRAETILDDDAPLSIGDRRTLRLATLAAQVRVRGAQSADPEMRSVLALFRRAANVLARLEDAVVFRGLVPDGSGGVKPGGGIGGIPPKLLEVHGGEPTSGLWIDPAPIPVWPPTGHELVRAVSEVIGNLEANGHFGPFAAVFGQKLFLIAQTPDDHSLVLPQDRIIPFLGGGTLLRSSTLDDVPFPSKHPLGRIVFKAQPTRGKTITLNGTVIKWGDGTDGSVPIGRSLNAAMENLVKFLKDNRDGDSQIPKCTYATIGPSGQHDGVEVTYRWPGLAGFSFTLEQDDPQGLVYLVSSPTLSDQKVHGGVIVALGGAPIELVVAQDMSLQFLQLTKDPYFLFRVREKIALRIKELKAIRGVYIEPKIKLTPNQGAGAGVVPITIENVYDAISVSVDNNDVKIDTVRATEITVHLPAHAPGPVTVKVITHWGSAEPDFTYT